MKKLLCVLMCLCMMFGVVACAEKEPIEKKYDLGHKPILNDIDFKIVDQKDKVWIEAEHVEEVYLCYEESKGRYIEIRLNDEGKEKLQKVTKKKRKELSVSVNGEIFMTPVTKHEYYDNCVVFLADDEEIMGYFNAIT